MLGVAGLVRAGCSAATAMTAVLFVGLNAPAAGDEPPKKCYEMVDLNVVEVKCEHSAETIRAARAADPGAKFTVRQLCKDGTSGEAEACSNPRACTVDGKVGTLYGVYRNGEREGIACLTAFEAAEVDQPSIRTLVIEAFERLNWPPSQLEVQPPNGKTLVNLETNFYTTNSGVASTPVDLLGTNVVVSARPIAYRWNFGDGTSKVTTTPGAPYPSLDVSHVYDQTAKVAVSVDTQYGDASFTVNGGPPEAIPSTIWVTGATQGLEVVEAVPQLVLE